MLAFVLSILCEDIVWDSFRRTQVAQSEEVPTLTRTLKEDLVIGPYPDQTGSYTSPKSMNWWMFLNGLKSHDHCSLSFIPCSLEECGETIIRVYFTESFNEIILRKLLHKCHWILLLASRHVQPSIISLTFRTSRPQKDYTQSTSTILALELTPTVKMKLVLWSLWNFCEIDPLLLTFLQVGGGNRPTMRPLNTSKTLQIMM